jgi:hypothetical protein
VCPWPAPNFTEAAALGRTFGQPLTPEVLDALDKDGWELYRMADDPTESRDVAAEHPDVVRELVALWWSEADKYKVLPLDATMQPRLAAERPQTSRPRTRFVYYPGGSVVPAFAAPPVMNRPYSIVADVEITNGAVAEGVLVAQGGDAGGFVLYLDGGRPRYTYNYMGRDRFALEAPDRLATGRHAVRYEFEPTGRPDLAHGKGTPGRAQLYVDDQLVANADFPHTVPFMFELEGLSCGYDFGAPAGEGYEPPFACTATLHSVTFDLSGELIPDGEVAVARLMAQQ